MYDFVPTLSTLLWACLVVCVAALGRFIAQGITMRRRILKLKGAGLPIMEPYSLIWGHLKVVGAICKNLPPDAHAAYSSRYIAENWQTFFPGAKSCPPLLYLDFWPLMPQMLVCVSEPDLCAEITLRKPLARSPMIRWSMWPLSSGSDLLSLDHDGHRVWRGRFNPAFSSRNIANNVPEILEKVNVFTGKIKSHAGKGKGEWGDVFPCYEMAVSLTFDVIAYFALGLQLDEQTTGPGPVRTALRNLIKMVQYDTVMSRLLRWTPRWQKTMAENRKVLRDAMRPSIQASIDRMGKDDDFFKPKTAVDYAVRGAGPGAAADDAFVEQLTSHVNTFLFAGHDTTAQSICWLLLEIYRRPEVLKRLRTEHAEVLGASAEESCDTIRQRPHLLNSLPYTVAVIRESLRHHNLVSAFRSSYEGFYLEHEGTKYPTDDATIVNAPDAMSQREDVWPRHREFIPERFLVGEGHELHPVPNAWRPFEMGSMRCIGEELAWTELKLTLVLLLRDIDYDFTCQPEPAVVNGRPATVQGETVYRCGDGVGSVKGDLLGRVRLCTAA